ncbi:MAG: long-chain fatty acid--CoA ligase [Clostridiaceae bacterium]|nr:long-chain fatty acid--CoA ligase [Clostridiaceae bacterium]
MQTIEDIGSYTIQHIFRNSVEKFSELPALSLVGKTPMTYSELFEKVKHYASLLKHIGIKKGDKIAILSPSTPKWGVAYFAIVCLGAIAIPLLPDFNKSEVEGMIKHSEACFAFVSKNNQEKLADCTTLQHIYYLEDDAFLTGEPMPIIDTSFDLFAEPINEEDTASIIYTSGTTGTPKGVELSHKNIAFMAHQSRLIQDIHPTDTFLSILPMSHVYEFSIGFIFPIMQGCHVCYLGRAIAVSSLLPALKTVRPTIMLSVPAVMEKIYKNKIVPSFEKNMIVAKLYRITFIRKILHRIAGKKLMDTFGGRIHFFGLGGAKLSPDVERFLKEAKFPYAIGYGLTETSPLIAGANPKKSRLQSTGPKMEGIEMKLIDVDPVSGIGEIVTKGPHVMKGYYKNEELTKSVFTEDGFFKTGDCGLIDKDGYLYIKGRKKNVIVGASGENIYPEDIEFVLNKHPLVLESLVIERDQKLVGLVKLDEDSIENSDLTPENPELSPYAKALADIRSYVNSQVNKFSKLKAIERIVDLEKTASQKIKRFLYSNSGKDKTTDDTPEKNDTGEKKDT